MDCCDLPSFAHGSIFHVRNARADDLSAKFTAAHRTKANSHVRVGLNPDVPAKGARLDITVETRDRAHADTILAAFQEAGFEPQRIATGAAMD